ncbi:amino acid adenylation domain-containing protein [Tumebacillus sp. BK434]|uniref:non-ribosomal peptide synthetase n=1 Tax=Tumebacillus sp. BK434 TaxID=2512169 RepID=UPI001048AAA1|nr:non-ribosomal peptide synthetase [Tumebacillus sp. BK434]TCP59320.1 amino acid adenylation domain-containing protein [Tumebacillus sp. BK434]
MIEIYEFPASFAQQRMWLLDQLSPGNPLYNTPAAVKLTGRLDADRLAHSLQEVVLRHEALQTTFELIEGVPMQVVNPERTAVLQRIDLQILPPEARAAELTRLAREEALFRFDLETGPLLRAVLVQTAAEQHVLLVNLHHIISDGWSVGVLIREISALYAGEELPELPLQYADYTLWQQEWLAGEVLDEQLAFWERTLGGELALLALPTDFPRPAEASQEGAVYRFALPTSLFHKLTALATGEGATLYMVLLAAFQALLHRYTGQTDVPVGTPVAGRGREEIEGLIGLFVNTLVMRTRVEQDLSFCDLLREVRRVALDAYAHADVPFEKVVERLQPERSRAYSPLFQVMFMLHSATAGELALPGVKVEPLQVESGLAKFDLSLMVEGEPGTLQCAFEYRTDLFAAETIARMAGHFVTLAEAMAERPDAAVGTLPLLTAAERNALASWNETAVAYPDDLCLHELFERQAEATPDAIAVVAGTVRWTYGELDQRANQTARLLRKRGVVPGQTVGVRIPRSPEQVAALLGVLKTGAAYVPLDPSLPPDRLRFLEQDAGVAVTLTHGLMAESATEPVEKIESGAAADSLAYLLYTSGSTGEPKGVAVPHRAICNHMQWLLAAYGIMVDDRVVQKTSFGFDASGIEFYGALLSGAQLVLADPEQSQDSAYLAQLIAEQEITVLAVVPSLLKVLLEEPGMAACTALRHVFCGGEALSCELQERCFDRLPHVSLHNLYGPTEACIDATAWTCQRGEAYPSGQVPIGRPIHNAQAHVLDPRLQPVPIGVAGELHIGGAGLAQGYWQQSKLTEEKFVPNPFGAGRLYKTGDLVRYRPDGALEFLGRIDQQVKVRGFRIETGEVEAAILVQPGVRDALVLAKDHRLIAYVTGGADVAQLKQGLLAKLPEYMVPSAIVQLEVFPRTANGKIDRAQLPVPEVAAVEFIAPRTSLEEEITAIWREVLAVERIGVEANFFELGGYSLLASQVMARLRQQFNVDLPLRRLFDAPTVADLATAVAGAQQVEGLSAMPKAPRGEHLPLSFAQERLWFFEQLQPGTAAYHIPSAVRLEGQLDLERLTASLQAIVDRHEALRTTFTEVEGQPRQVVQEAMPIALGRIGEQELEAEAARPFDLEKGPLLRAALVQHGEAEHTLLLTLHHLVADGWSMDVLIRELTALYGNAVHTLPALPVQYADYACWQREQLQGDALEAGLAYWRGQLGGTQPVLQVPTDRPRPAVQTYRGAVERTLLPTELVAQLRQVGDQEAATLFMTLLAAYQTLLYRYTGQEDLRIGTPVANRSRVEVEELIGFFVNTLVLRADVSGTLSFRELLRQVRETALDAFAHEEVPFEQLVKELQPERDLSHTPLFQTLFVLQNTPRAAFELPGLTLTPLDVNSGAAKFDLTLSVMETEAGLLCHFEYNADLFEAATIKRMAGHFETLLASIAMDSTQLIGLLNIMTESEKDHVQTLWGTNLHHAQMKDQIYNQNQAQHQNNDWSHHPHLSSAGEETNLCLHQLFEAQAVLTPDAPAVTYNGISMTYRELNERANHLAHLLRAKGVGQDQLVGLCTERDPEMIVGLLGILKAGGAYLPLDPAYPSERLSFLLADADIRIIVTQEQTALPAHTADAILITDGRSPLNPPCHTTPDNLAYVIYTSGSTGQPKGVLIPHANVARLFTATEHWFQFRADDVWTLFHSYAFDFSVWEIWGALLYGGRLVIVPYLTSRSPEQFYRLLCAEGVTVLNQTPSAFRQLLQADAVAGTSADTLRYVIFGGEALDMHSLAPWFERHGDERPQLINMYGITETTVHVTYRPLTQADLSRGSIIGVPIPDLSVRILDRFGQPVPLGIPGELHVGGAGVAQGYLNRPELTAERFTDGFYKTGDLVRLLPGGDLEYLGRIDQQVKIRGFRIELGEIEAALVQSPAIREAVVTAQNDRLIAYLVPETDCETGDLRSFLQQKLPGYMLPSAFVYIDRLPLTPNGKVDIRALPQPDGQSRANAYAAPQTDAERALCAIFQQVLGTGQVGCEDNFFERGGDSILCIQAVAAARKQGYELSLQEMFRQPTVRDLAATMQTASCQKGTVAPFGQIAASDRELLPEDLEDAYPLTKLQAGMLFHSAASGDASVYHNVNTYHLRAPFAAEQLARTVDALAQQHPVLRTSFDLTSYSEPLQLVHRAVRIPLDIEDLRQLPAAEQERHIADWFEQEKARHFDWTQAPLLRLKIHRRTEETFQFSFTEHHAILDGWSVATMITAFFRSYLTGLPMEQPPPLFRDYCALESAAVSSDEQKNFWLRQLDEFTFTKVPRLPRTVSSAAAGQQLSVNLPFDPAQAQVLKQLAHSAGVPLKSVLLAAHLRVLSFISGHQDVTTGVVANGRPEQEGGERALGLFLNTLPLRQKLRGGTWLDLIRDTFHAEQDLLPHRRYPMMQIQQDHGGHTLFETAFNFTHFHVYSAFAELPQVEVLEAAGIADTNFALSAEFSQNVDSGELSLLLRYDGGEFGAEQITALSGYYRRCFQAMAENAASRYETHSLLAADDLQKLREWKRSDPPHPADLSVHERIALWAAQTPDKPAVVFRDEQLTYRELEARANRLARHLRSCGVGPDTLVGISVERCLEMIVGVLGILKAGGAFVPLDPNYPEERLAYMIGDAGLRLLLTQARFADKLQNLQPGGSLALLRLDADWPIIGQQAADPVPHRAGADDLAYVIYTSGSTGRPKGVLLQHKGLNNMALSQHKTFHVDATSRVLQFASFSFDASVSEIFMALVHGGTLYLAGQDELMPGVDLLNTLRRHRITTVTLPPSALAVMEDDGLPDLQTIISAGEACTAELIARWSQGRAFINGYGPSEATCCTSAEEYRDANGTEAVLIGRPFAGVDVYVLDEHGQPVPAGTPGELHVGGISVGRGYHDRPELNAASFQERDGERLYKTGDLVRWLPDGRLEYISRRDHQVKIRGFRIETGEIENRLSQHPAVGHAIVLVREDVPGDKRLAAYVVLRDEAGQATADDLRGFLQAGLPEHMVPSHILLLEAMPLTPNGKIDRRALPVPIGVRPPGESEYAAPRDLLELELVQLWESLLHIAPIGIRDNFFLLGGHSLLAVRMMAMIQKKWGQDLPFSALSQGGTIEDLAVMLREGGTHRRSSLIPLQAEGTRPPFFCVHAVGGSVLSYVHLAKLLGPEQPFYGLQSPGLDDDREPFTDITRMAAHYIEELRRVQPLGPYHLGGWSLGGVMAFEMAQQLRQAGEEVALLAIFDSFAPLLHNRREFPTEASILAGFSEYLAASSGVEIADGMEEHLYTLQDDAAFRFVLEQTIRQNILPRDISFQQFYRLYRVFRANLLSVHDYTPQAYAGDITLFKATEFVSIELATKINDEPTMGWGELVQGEITTHPLPGTHFSIVRLPHVERLAQELEKVIHCSVNLKSGDFIGKTEKHQS